MVIPAREVWAFKPSFDEFMDELQAKILPKRPSIYMRGKPYEPRRDIPFYRVISQLWVPDVSNTMYATNLESQESKMRIPEILAKYDVYDDEPTMTTNITPQYTVVDIHIGWCCCHKTLIRRLTNADCSTPDHGKHVVTSSHGGCVKLFITWPPSHHNLALYSKAAHSNNMLVTLHQGLEGCQMLLITDEDAILLDSGTLHATVTLRGGATPGIEFTSAKCLDITHKLLEMHSETQRLGRDVGRPFLEAVMVASRDVQRRRRALDLFCAMYPTLSKAKCDLLAKARKAVAEGTDAKSCASCGKLWGRH